MLQLYSQYKWQYFTNIVNFLTKIVTFHFPFKFAVLVFFSHRPTQTDTPVKSAALLIDMNLTGQADYYFCRLGRNFGAGRQPVRQFTLCDVSHLSNLWQLNTVRKKHILQPCLVQKSDIYAKVRQLSFSDPFSL